MSKSKLLKVLLVTSVIVALAITACFGLVACKDKHEHTYSTTWNNDTTNHWHDATCEHKTEKSDLAKHDTNGTDGACSVCDYKPTTVTPPAHEHTLSGWVNTDPAEHYKTCTGNNCTESLGARIEKGAHDTNGTDGACSVCGYKATVTPPDHVHTPSEWTYDDGTGHYKTCTGANCTEAAGTKIETGTHDTDGTDGACSKCGYKATPSHEHTFADGWTNDATGHWHAATCDHDTEIDAFAAHDTNGADGACSVCGYSIYNELAAKEGMIIADKFATAVAKLPEFSETYGTAGLYSSRNSGTGITTDTHYVKVEGGKAVMVDPGNGETHLVVDFGLTTGTIEGYFEVTLKNSGTKWTFAQFVNVSGSEVFGLRTDESNKIIYRLGSSDTTGSAGLSDITASSDTTYKIYFKFDGTTKKLTMTINGLDFAKDVQLTVSELGGVRLVSSNSGNKTTDLDNLVIVNDATLADLKTVVAEKLNAVYTSYNVAVNYTTNGADVTAAKDAGVTAITDATTKAELVTAYNTAIDAMKAVKSDLAIYKEGKVADLEAYATAKGESNYTEANWATLQDKVAEGTANINKASDTAAVDAALQAAKDAIDAVPDNSEQIELNNRDDVEVTISVSGTPQVFNGKSNDTATNVKINANEVHDFLTFVSGTNNFKANNDCVSIKDSGVVKFTTTTPNATITFVYTSVSSGRKFSIKLGDTVVFADEEPNAWVDENKVKLMTKTFTLETAGEYTLAFDASEHKIGTITLTETASQTVTAKVNKVDATLVATPVAGVEVANLVSKVTVQCDHGEMTNVDVTEKDQYTVIVKDSAGEAVATETLEAGTYTVLVIFGADKAESNATQYNSHTYTVTVAAAE